MLELKKIVGLPLSENRYIMKSLESILQKYIDINFSVVVGAKVMYVGATSDGVHYPSYGAVGTLLRIDECNSCLVRWPSDTVWSGGDRPLNEMFCWYVDLIDLRVFKERWM